MQSGKAMFSLSHPKFNFALIVYKKESAQLFFFFYPDAYKSIPQLVFMFNS